MTSSHMWALLRSLYRKVLIRQQALQAEARGGLAARRAIYARLEEMEPRTLLSVTVTAATGGTGISADHALNGADPLVTALGSIVIAEPSGGLGNFYAATGKTLVLNAPTGWKFVAGSESVSFTEDMDITAAALSLADSAVTITFSVGGTTKRDTMIISGLQVEAIDGAGLPGGNILRSSTSTSTISGVSGTTNFGTLSQVAGATTRVGFLQQPPNENLGVTLSPSPTVQLQDAFGNSTTGTADVTVAIEANPGEGTLSGTTTVTTAASGLATFSTLSIDQAGAGYTLTASSPGLTSATSNAFTINKLSTTTALAALTTSTYGQEITFTATVTGSIVTPTGIVNFKDGSTVIGSGTLSGTGTTATATFTTSLLSGGNHTITAVYTGDDNFNNSTSSGRTQTVNKAVLTVTADPASRAYGDANPAFTASFTGFQNDQEFSTSGITGAPGLTTPATKTSAVGTYTITAAVGTMSSTNYSFTYVSGTLTVDKAELTVSSALAKAYGDDNPTLTPTYTGFKNSQTLATSGVTGNPVLATTAATDSPVGAYAVTVDPGTLAASNYFFTCVEGTLTVNKAALTVTPDAASRTYGDPNPAFTATLSGFKLGQTLETSGVTGSPELSTAATETTNAGAATITATAGDLAADNYSFTMANGTLTIAKAELIVTSHASRGYGDANPTLPAEYSGFKNGQTLATSGVTGSPTRSTTATAASPVGEYTITVAQYTLAAANYSFTCVNGTLTVNKAVLTVSAAAAGRAYGDANPAFTPTYTGFKNSQTLATSGVTGSPAFSTAADAFSGAGAYAIDADPGTLTAGNYSFNCVAGTLTVNKAVLTVTADAATRIYGDANPTFTASYSGFKNAETLETSGVTGAPALTTTATVTTAVGTPTITAAVGTLTASNYSFTCVNGTMTITKAPLAMTANDVSRTYGSNNPTLTASYTGFKNGQTASVLGGSPSLTCPATATSQVGTYTITAGAGTVYATNYYVASCANGTLTVNQAVLTVTAGNASRVYGNPNPTFTVTYTGFKNSQNLATSGVTGSPDVTTEATPSSPVTTYAITPSLGTLDAVNYSFAFANGTLTVTKAALTATADPQSRYYGDPNPTFTVTYTGFKNDETLETSDLTGNLNLTCSATTTSSPNNYTISNAIGTLTSTNYTITRVNGLLTVTKAPLTVTANAVSRAYGDANPALTALYSGFKNGQTFATSGISGSPAISTTATATTPAGEVAISVAQGNLASTNYSFTCLNGTLTVNKATLAVSSESTRVYGDANVLVPTYVGFKNGQNLSTSGVIGEPILTTDATDASPVGAYAVAVERGTLDAQNYDFTITPGTLTVTKASVVVTADSYSRPYGDTNPEFAYTYSGWKLGQAYETSGATGGPTLTCLATADSDVGEYAITADTGTLTAHNYSFSRVHGVLTVTPVMLTVSATGSRVYGDANPALTALYSGFRNGQTLATSGVTGAPEMTTDADPFSPVGAHAIAVGAGTLTAVNYTFNFADGALVVTQAPLTVSAVPVFREYGDYNPSFETSYTGFKNGETLSTCDLIGEPALTTLATEASDAGVYTITVGLGTLTSGNYALSAIDSSLTITKATLTVWADSTTREYGLDNPELTCHFTGFVNGQDFSTSGVIGEASLETTATIESPVGLYAVTVSEGTLAANNYAFQFVPGELDIRKAALEVTAEPAFREYGQDNPPFVPAFYGFRNGQDLATSGVLGSALIWTEATPLSPADRYAIVVEHGSLTSDNYDFIFCDTLLTVQTAALTVTAMDAGREYGDVNPAFTPMYSGFRNGEELSTSGVTGQPDLLTLADESSDAGAYTIWSDLGTLAAENYHFQFVNGTLTIEKAVLTITADAASREQGAPNPTFTFSCDGFKNGQTLHTSDVTGEPALTTTADLASPPGDYDIVAAAGTLASGNYEFAFVGGVLTVTAQSVSPAPTSLVLAAGSDTGISDSDRLTRLSCGLSVRVQGDPGATAAIYEGDTLLGSASCDLEGVAVITIDPEYTLSNGEHSLCARQTLPGRGESVATEPLTVIVDATAPQVLSAERSGIASFSFEFDDDLSATLGAGTLLLHNNTTGQDILLDPDGTPLRSVAHTATWSAAAALPGGEYTATILPSVTDAAGNPLANPSAPFTIVSGDVDCSGAIEPADIDLLRTEFGPNALYDLNGDSAVNTADVDHLVREIVGTNYGDANLDRFIDFTDFQALLDNWQAASGWGGADFTGDGTVDFADFQMLLDYWNPTGFAAQQQAAVTTTDTQPAATTAASQPVTATVAATAPTSDVTADITVESTPPVSHTAAPASQQRTAKRSLRAVRPVEDSTVDILTPLYSKSVQ